MNAPDQSAARRAKNLLKVHLLENSIAFTGIGVSKMGDAYCIVVHFADKADMPSDMLDAIDGVRVVSKLSSRITVQNC